ncbi:hypothetical protein SVEN_0053 [Streptomyces venezuelae ATCC 10712]|uniref:Uncharacterized protein n=1 Tax=Streptomyces venezuelae (strain ATCC 10712 / CBS 650.69 / DSM 40230 / JCM 4526 / NBRC 13096 / PD 04745) TaxID=953739 RepID=F2R395_STRVP|nr:hypothetical protein SVEN_0053 [Streptomyces venezuelae ATCC 10712]
MRRGSGGVTVQDEAPTRRQVPLGLRHQLHGVRAPRQPPYDPERGPQGPHCHVGEPGHEQYRLLTRTPATLSVPCHVLTPSLRTGRTPVTRHHRQLGGGRRGGAEELTNE